MWCCLSVVVITCDNETQLFDIAIVFVLTIESGQVQYSFQIQIILEVEEYTMEIRLDRATVTTAIGSHVHATDSSSSIDRVIEAKRHDACRAVSW